MKMLLIENKHAYLKSAEDSEPAKILDIDEDAILGMVNTIMGDTKIELDEIPDEDSCPNEAESAIYEELHKQILDLISRKPSILKNIDEQFEKAEALYGESLPANDLSSWSDASDEQHE